MSEHVHSQLGLPHGDDAPVANKGETDERPLERVEDYVGIPEGWEVEQGRDEAKNPSEAHNG